MVNKITSLFIIVLLISGCGTTKENNSSNDLSPEKIEALAVLGKVWGFLKYYHPVVATGKYDWDKTLIQLIPKILEAENTDQRNTILSNLIDTLGKFVVNSRQDTLMRGEVKMRPDLGWINQSNFGPKLTNQLRKIKAAERTGKNFYVRLYANVGNPIFNNEREYIKMKFPKKEYRLLCLFRYWNIIQYYFPNKHLIEENWNNVLKEFIPKFINVRNELEYKKCVLSLTGRIHDTHAFFRELGSYPFRESIGDRYAPFSASFIENKFVVTKYENEKIAKETGLKIGDIIKEINEKPIEEIIKEKLEFTPGSNYSVQLRDMASTLLTTNDTVLKITYLRGRITKKINIKCRTYNYHINNYSFGSEVDFKLIGCDISYIYPGLIKNDALPKIMKKILKTKGLIIDFRCYPSDFTVFSFGQYLVPDSTCFAKYTVASITTPGLFQFPKFSDGKIGYKNKNYYKGKIIILVNEETQSSAEYHCMAFQTAPRATVIGSTTAGADGNVSEIKLPGGISTMISGIGILYPDGRETQRVGVAIDIVVKPTIKGIIEGRDELLEKAIELINQK